MADQTAPQTAEVNPLDAIDKQKAAAAQQQQQQGATQQGATQQQATEVNPLDAIDKQKQQQQQQTTTQGGDPTQWPYPGESWPYKIAHYLNDPNVPPASWLNQSLVTLHAAKPSLPGANPPPETLPLPHWSDITSALSDPEGLAATIDKGMGFGFGDPAAATTALLDTLRVSDGKPAQIPGNNFTEKYKHLSAQNAASVARYAGTNPTASQLGEFGGNVITSIPTAGISELAALKYGMPALRYVAPTVIGGHEGYVNTPPDAPPGEKLANTITGAAAAALTQGVSDVGLGTAARLTMPANRPIPPSGPIVWPLIKGTAKGAAGAALEAAASHPQTAPYVGHIPHEYGLYKILESGTHNIAEGLANLRAKFGNWWGATQPTGPAVRSTLGTMARGRPIYQTASSIAGTAASPEVGKYAANSTLADLLAQHVPNWDPASLAGYSD